MSDNHDHDNEEGKAHPGFQPDIKLSYHAKRALAMKELLIEKGIMSQDDMQANIARQGLRSPADGARVVARAWVDPEYKKRLLTDPKAAVEELGYSLPHDMPRLAVIENTDEVRHLIVCTLCSCYPGMLLGPPPDWYKSFAYRSRAVRTPRSVMGEFGLDVGEDVEVRVVDSTADLRYMVLPQRPPRTEGMSEEELTKLVTRDSMIGVSDPLSPAASAQRA